MKVCNLNARTGSFIAAIALGLFTISCNDSDKSAKNSTTPVTNTDTVKTGNTTTSKIGKKTGKASVTLMAEDKTAKIAKDEKGYYSRTETMPVYPGGQEALQDYVANNIQYPDDAINNNMEGVVNVRFTIDEQGHVSNVSTIGNKLGYGMEEEAMKVVSGMPSWTPGMIKGKKVKAWYTLPISYKLDQ